MAAQASDGPTLTIALAPTVGRATGGVQTRPALAAYLQARLGRPVRVVIEPSYAATAEGLRSGRLDAAFMGELAALRSQEAGNIEPLVIPVEADGQIPTYQSVFVTRLDAGMHDLSALRGMTIGLVDEQSTSGYLVPRAMLREAGLDPDRDVTVRLLKRHAAVVEAVLAHEVAAGATHAGHLKPPTLDRGADYARLRVLASSRPIPRGPLVVRADLPSNVRTALADALVRVHADDPAAADVLNVRHGQRFTHAERRQAATLKSIAALSGVSYATVSRVVNGTGYVAPATAARVAAIVQELGYRPNGNARTLQGQGAQMVGIVVPWDVAPDVRRKVRALAASLATAGVPFVLCPVDGPLAHTVYPGLLMDGRLGALAVTTDHAGDPDLADLVRTGRAVFALDVEDAAFGVVGVRYEQAAVAILAALGIEAAPPALIGSPR